MIDLSDYGLSNNILKDVFELKINSLRDYIIKIYSDEGQDITCNGDPLLLKVGSDDVPKEYMVEYYIQSDLNLGYIVKKGFDDLVSEFTLVDTSNLPYDDEEDEFDFYKKNELIFDNLVSKIGIPKNDNDKTLFATIYGGLIGYEEIIRSACIRSIEKEEDRYRFKMDSEDISGYNVKEISIEKLITPLDYSVMIPRRYWKKHN